MHFCVTISNTGNLCLNHCILCWKSNKVFRFTINFFFKYFIGFLGNNNFTCPIWSILNPGPQCSLPKLMVRAVMTWVKKRLGSETIEKLWLSLQKYAGKYPLTGWDTWKDAVVVSPEVTVSSCLLLTVSLSARLARLGASALFSWEEWGLSKLR